MCKTMGQGHLRHQAGSFWRSISWPSSLDAAPWAAQGSVLQQMGPERLRNTEFSGIFFQNFLACSKGGVDLWGREERRLQFSRQLSV